SLIRWLQMKVVDALARLSAEELYDDVILIYGMNPCFTKGMPRQTKSKIHRFAGEAYFQNGRYELALKAYREALRVYPSNLNTDEEADLRYRMARCLFKLGNLENAMATLNLIKPAHQKARMKKLEILLWEKMGIDNSKSNDPIFDAHVALVTFCSECVTSLKYLTRLRDKKYSNLFSSPSISDLPFLSPWWEAQSAWGHDDLIGAVSILMENAKLAPRLASLEAGQMLLLIGMKEDAVDLLKKARQMDVDNTEGVNMLVNALGQLAVDESDRLNDLEQIVLQLTTFQESCPEAILAYGQLSRVKEVRRKEESAIGRTIKHEVPLHFAHQASAMSLSGTIDATLLKMQILNDMERYTEVLEIGSSIMRRGIQNMDVYEQMVSANVMLKRVEGARLLCLSAMDAMPGPRSALLYAHVLTFKHDSTNEEQGTEHLRKVVEQYPYFVDAAVIYADALIQRDMFDMAISTLKRVIQRVPFVHRVVSGQLTKTLSECQLKQNEYIAAYDNMHRSVVLGVETSNSPMADLNDKMGEEVEDASARVESMEEDIVTTPSPSLTLPHPSAPFRNRRRPRNDS
ncbi:hypothetical protein PFISCL1PPCAC_15599, partial [Pristionchus fissidentatus]